MVQSRPFIDGEAASYDDLAHLALAHYGAYTSFRVERVGVRGLDLHLSRLGRQAVELFGVAPTEARFRDRIASALNGRLDAFLRVSLFSRHITHRDAGWIGEPSILVMVADPPGPLQGPLRLQLRRYQRESPELKHTATFGLMRARRLARAEGYDDALFVDASGRISEGSLWNIGFLSGDQVIWPQAPMLAGVAQALMDRGLAGQGFACRTEVVTVHDLAGFDGAVITNSATPACAVASIGDLTFTPNESRVGRLAAAYDAAPIQPI